MWEDRISFLGWISVLYSKEELVFTGLFQYKGLCFGSNVSVHRGFMQLLSHCFVESLHWVGTRLKCPFYFS